MIPDTEFTDVIFRRFRDGDVIALFPTLPGTNDWPNDCQSYQHVGQHGTASVFLTLDTKPAAPEHYAALLRELISLGYRPRVRRRFAPTDAYKRRAAIEAVRA